MFQPANKNDSETFVTMLIFFLSEVGFVSSNRVGSLNFEKNEKRFKLEKVVVQ
jgi:hypothetical protein